MTLKADVSLRRDDSFVHQPGLIWLPGSERFASLLIRNSELRQLICSAETRLSGTLNLVDENSRCPTSRILVKSGYDWPIPREVSRAIRTELPCG
jgi:hypothetical protein